MLFAFTATNYRVFFSPDANAFTPILANTIGLVRIKQLDTPRGVRESTPTCIQTEARPQKLAHVVSCCVTEPHGQPRMPQQKLDTRGQRSPAAPFVVRAHSLGGGGGGNGGQQQQRAVVDDDEVGAHR